MKWQVWKPSIDPETVVGQLLQISNGPVIWMAIVVSDPFCKLSHGSSELRIVIVLPPQVELQLAGLKINMMVTNQN